MGGLSQSMGSPMQILVLYMSLTSVSGFVTYYQTLPSKNENNEVVYQYRYSVDDQKSGVVKDQWEQRIGQFVKGAYSLLEPSGKVRTVSYEVDGNRGFVAVVKTHVPAIALQSTQQMYKANQLFPEPLVNLNHPAISTNSYNPFPRYQPSRQGFQNGFQGGGNFNFRRTFF